MTLWWRELRIVSACCQSPWDKSEWEKKDGRKRVLRLCFPGVCQWGKVKECCSQRNLRVKEGFICVCCGGVILYIAEAFGSRRGEKNDWWSKTLEEMRVQRLVQRRETFPCIWHQGECNEDVSKYLKRARRIRITPRCWAKKTQMLLHHFGFTQLLILTHREAAIEAKY